MARRESADVATIDDASAVISIAHERLVIILTRSAHRLTAMDVAELAELDDDLDRLHHYLLALRPLAATAYQRGNL